MRAKKTSNKLADTRKKQLASIKKALKLRNCYFAKYEQDADVIVVGNNSMTITFGDQYLNRKDYMDAVKYGYGRFVEAMEWDLLTRKPQGHA